MVPKRIEEIFVHKLEATFFATTDADGNATVTDAPSTHRGWIEDSLKQNDDF